MKHYLLALALLISFSASAQNFITRWVFPTASNSITFNGLTAGEVVCRWTTSSNPIGGTLRFSNSNENLPIRIAIPIPAGDTVTLHMEPANLRRFFLNGGYNGANFSELTEVRQWGNVAWQSMEVAFVNCPNFKLLATDVPNLSGVRSMKQMFWFSRNFVPPFNMDLWNVSSVTDMESMFAETGSFNRDLTTWNLSSLTNAAGMFSNSGISCENYSRTIKAWAENPNTPNTVNFSVQRGAVYANTAETFRNALIAKGWSISMDAKAIPGNPCYDMSLPVIFGEVNASLKNGMLQVNWATLTEKNNGHFDIEASADGAEFTKIGEVLPKFPDGNSSVPLQYEFSKKMSSIILSACIGILALSSIGASFSRHKKARFSILLLAGIGLSIISCTKSSLPQENKNSNFYIRIKQVDIDGNFKNSAVVKVVKE
ncbi:BspA family leucine-rich repeat surface protein [Niabella yanshanensis]|uniref:BspA family leucine-rich repeat surface protein n=1 Tax=Niabella yanshanensis TaxID=577386 RepID=A0ABZ0W684_9BACT|nr:BspA family leucine-rich repeat surface protein [Niabella yanshanensis]WQD38022.1 BspA family leucine-rich repeat surface protein [Niabella yanshanensis]